MFTLRDLIEGEWSFDRAIDLLHSELLSQEDFDDFSALWHRCRPSNWDGKSLGWSIWYWPEWNKCEIVLGKVHPIAQEHAYMVFRLVAKAYGCEVCVSDQSLAGWYWVNVESGVCMVAQPFEHSTDPTGKPVKEE